MSAHSWVAAAVSTMAFAFATPAVASESQCPASEPYHYENWAAPWQTSTSGSGAGTTLSLGAEIGRHYQRLTMEFDMTIDGFDAGSQFVPIVWVRNAPFETPGAPAQYDWFLIKNSSPQRTVSIVENEVLDFQDPASWSATTYHVEIDMDALAGVLSITATDDQGNVNALQRPFEQSIVPLGQGLRLIWGWHEINLDIVYPPWGWTFANLVVDMEPGGPMGPLAAECPGGLDWVTESLPDGTVGEPYGPVSLEAMAGTEVYTFTVEEDTPLPAGLSLDPTGTLSGTPTEAGVTAVGLRVTDDNAEYIVRELSIDIAEGPAAEDSGDDGTDASDDGGVDDGMADGTGGDDGGDDGMADGTGDGAPDGDGGLDGGTDDDALPGGFGDDRGAEGCGCRADGRAPLGWLVLVALALVRRTTRRDRPDAPMS